MGDAPPPPSVSPPAGWFRVSEQADTWRWWDGRAWTDEPEPRDLAVDLSTIYHWLEEAGIGVSWEEDKKSLVAVLASDSTLATWIRPVLWDQGDDVAWPALPLLTFELPLVLKVPADAPTGKVLSHSMPIGHLVLTDNRVIVLRWRSSAMPAFISGPAQIIEPLNLLENAANQVADNLVKITGGVEFEA